MTAFLVDVLGEDFTVRPPAGVGGRRCAVVSHQFMRIECAHPRFASLRSDGERGITMRPQR